MYQGRMRWQSIQSARAGVHSTIYGDVLVEHHGDKTFCRAYAPKAQHLVPYADTGFGHPGERVFALLAERQATAQQEFAPRLTEDDVLWRNGVGLPRSFVRAQVAAAEDAGLSVPDDIMKLANE